MKLPISQTDLDIFTPSELEKINEFMKADADAFNLLDENKFVTELDGQWVAVIGEDNFYFDTEEEAIDRISQ